MRKKVICEVSARHYHPSKEEVATKKRDLSQKNHWVAHEKVKVHEMSFSVVMPPRKEELYEMSLTDWYSHMEGEPQFEGTFQVKLRHFHCDAALAQEWGIPNTISLEVGGLRAGILKNVLVRIDDWAVPRVHLDTDEANALNIKNGQEVEIFWGE